MKNLANQLIEYRYYYNIKRADKLIILKKVLWGLIYIIGQET
jgi:hypothetical protein